jgi:hypothetical protein
MKRHRRPLGSGDDTALLILRFERLPSSGSDSLQRTAAPTTTSTP